MEKESTTLFPVLSLAKIKKPSETDRKLPTWLSQPTQFLAVNIDSGQDIDQLAQCIDQDLRSHLKNVMSIDRMFPVQECLIPHLTMQFKSRLYRRPNDICVSSPTGSGKTLAFAIPIVNYLKQSLNRSLRALVILPSRDLAQQVYKAFQQVSTPTSLRCALAAGEGSDFHAAHSTKLSSHYDVQLTPQKNNLSRHELFSIPSQGEDFVNTADILVSTPGVLVDLLHNSRGFSLKDLEILVIDEADRLMTSHKHDWLNKIERSIFQDVPDCPCKAKPDSRTMEVDGCDIAIKRQRVCYSSTTGCTIRHFTESKPLHKLLFSATLSSDPQILMHMNLFQPRLFLATKPSITSTKIRQSLGSQQSTPSSSPLPQVVGSVHTRNELLTSSAIPEQLEEKMFITEAREKLFIIWYLFHELQYRKVICFTNQLQTSSRLCKFLNQIHQVRAVEFSSNLKPETRQKYLNEFAIGRVDVIVSTDLMARGIDLEGVDYVISYDIPPSEIFYVHRVGRTARAGRKGTAITLVDAKQLVRFKKMIQLAHKMPNSMRLGDVIEDLRVPSSVKKSSEKYELYCKTLDDYEDKLNSSMRRKFPRKNKPHK